MNDNNRILIIDDDPGVRESYTEILSPSPSTDVLAIGNALFGGQADDYEAAAGPRYDLMLAENGAEGIRLAVEAREQGRPFATAFIDMKMPGIDGAETAKRIWAVDADLTIVIVTAYSEYTPDDIIRVTGRNDIFYLRKPFNAEEIRQFARALTNQWNLERAKELHRKHQEDDLRAAAEIQRSLLPRESPTVENFQFAWQFMPCKQIGGDIFNIHRLNESHLALYVVDVSGHGVPAAMVTVSVSQTLLPTTGSILKHNADGLPGDTIVPPVDVLTSLDREYPMDRFGKYFTIAYLILNTETGHIRYSSAGHPMPVLVRANGDIELLREGGTIIGMGAHIPFEEGDARMYAGDRLFLYTDGIVENMNEADEEFGHEKFYDQLVKLQQNDLDVVGKRIIEAVVAHGNNPIPQDDITLLAVEYRQKQ